MRHQLLLNILIAIAYWVTGHFGLLLPYAGEFVTLIWPPLGIATACMLYLGWRVAPGVFIGAFAVNYQVEPSVLIACGIACGNTAGPFLATHFLRKHHSFKRDLGNTNSLVLFLGFAALLGPTITALNGAAVLMLAGKVWGSGVWDVLRTWFIGDAAGVITWTPIFLLANWRETRASLKGRFKTPELLACLLLLWLPVDQAFRLHQSLTAGAFLLMLVPFAPLSWLAVRLHPWIAAAASFAAAHWALWWTSQGIGPFANLNLHTGLATCWAYFGLLLLLTLTLSALTSELSHALIEARAAHDTKAKFMATMSHELRTPMNGVLGMIDLARDLMSESEEKRLLTMAHSSASALLRILDDVLDLSKCEAGRTTLSPTVFSLPELVREIETLFASKFAERGVSFSLSTASSCPEWVSADSLRLRQILVNLLGNAIKFTDERGVVALYVDSEASPDGKSCALTFHVVDAGIGISEEKLNSIFDPFAQEDDTISRRFGGTGLGLPIARSLARLMGGDLTVVSRKGVGSRFSATVQCLLAEPPKSVAPLPNRKGAEQREAEEVATQSVRILLAEDNRVNQQLFSMILERAGYSVSLVNNGLEAVNAVQQADYDLIFLDIQMPVLDGVAAAKQISKLQKVMAREVPIVAVTAHAMSGDCEHYLTEGFSAYLAKPINRAALLEMVKSRAAELRRLQITTSEATTAVAPE